MQPYLPRDCATSKASRPTPSEIAVAAPEPRLLIHPRLYERAPETMVAPLAELFDAVDVRYERGEVDVIDSESNSVVIVGPDGMRRSLHYDRLVLAAGSQGVKPDIPGLDKYGFSVDQFDDAIALDHHLNALANRSSSAARDTAVVAGGGFTGIEVATEMPSRLRVILGPRDVDRPLRVARALQAGTVWINDWASIHDEFEEGGFKQSGRGRLRGQAGLDDFLECKHIAFKAGTKGRQ